MDVKTQSKDRTKRIAMARNTCENMLTNDIKCHRELRYVIGHRVQDNMGENGDRPSRKTARHASPANFVVQPLKWLQVCGTCDRQIGRRNLMRLGWSKQEAIQWEREPDMPSPSKRLQGRIQLSTNAYGVSRTTAVGIN